MPFPASMGKTSLVASSESIRPTRKLRNAVRISHHATRSQLVPTKNSPSGRTVRSLRSFVELV